MSGYRQAVPQPEDLMPQEVRLIRSLKAHPKQHEYYGDINQDLVHTLFLSIRKEGLRQPIEILSDGTIIAGHHRTEAMTRLGEK